MLTEADTCTRFVVSLLRASGWDDAPHSFAQEHCFTDGRIVLIGNKVNLSQVEIAERMGLKQPLLRDCYNPMA